MAVQLSSLRVDASFDASGYARGAAQKTDADARMIAADKAFMTSQAQIAASLGRTADAVGRSDSAARQGSGGWVDFAAKIYLAKTAVEGFIAANDYASDGVGRFVSTVTSAAGTALMYLPKKVGEVWQEGTDRLDQYIVLSQKAGTLGTDFYQRIVVGSNAAKMASEDLLKAIENVDKSLQRNFNNVLNDPSASAFSGVTKTLSNNGNLQGLGGQVTRVGNSVDPEEQLREGAKLIQGVLDQGATLAAYKISDSLFGGEATENLRKDNDYFLHMIGSLDAVKAENLIKQADVDRAVGLKIALDAAFKTLDDRGRTTKSDWSGWGIEIQAAWVGVVQQYVGAVTWLDKILGRTQDIVAETKRLSLRDYLKGAQTDAYGNVDYTKAPVGPSDLELANRALASQMQNPQNITNARLATQRAGDIGPDYSLANNPNGQMFGPEAPKKQTQPEEADDRVDTAINTLRRHTEQQIADTNAMGLGVGALARFRAEAAETSAVQANGGKITAEQAAQFDILKTRAADAAVALEKARVANDIRFGQQTALLSPDDVQIAQKLKGLYPDVGTALASVEASGLRANAALSQVSSTVSSDLTTGIADAVDGTKSLGQAFSDTSKLVIRAIEEMIIKLLVVGPLMQTLQSSFGGLGLAGGTGSIGGTLGSAGVTYGTPGAAGSNLFGPLAPSARGNIFAGGNIIPFARGGVVNRPVFFPMANGGTGLMGEAGPEAVMPLRRGPDGRLGVSAGGYGAANDNSANGGPVTVNIYNAPAGSDPQTNVSKDANGTTVDVMFKNAVTGLMVDDATRNGPIAQAMTARQRGFGS